MNIIKFSEIPTFDSDVVKQSGFIQARYQTWPEPRNGLVTHVQADRITCLFQKETNAAVAYFTIRATEEVAGTWEIIYKTNLEE